MKKLICQSFSRVDYIWIVINLFPQSRMPASAPSSLHHHHAKSSAHMSRHGKIDSLKSQPIKLELCVLCSAASAPSLARAAAAGQHAAETSTRIATQTGNGRAKSRFTPPSPSPQSRTRSGRPEAEERRSGSAGSGRMISSGRDRGGLRAPQRWKRQRPTSPSSVRFAVSLVQVASPRGGCIVESISSKDCVN